MKNLLSVAIICIVFTQFSCSKELVSGNGPIVSENRNISGFTAISALGSTNVYVYHGSVFKVEVKGYSNLLQYYETKVVNNTLEVGYKHNMNIKNDNTVVLITLPVLNGLALSGSGIITTTGSFDAGTSFNASVSGSGKINFSSGTAQNFYSKIDGSGSINMLNMLTDKADVIINGSGNIEISANNLLNVKITGSGKVYYQGSPIMTTNIIGSGSVMRK